MTEPVEEVVSVEAESAVAAPPRRKLDVAWLALVCAVLFAPLAVGQFGPTGYFLADIWGMPKLVIVAAAALVGVLAFGWRYLNGEVGVRLNRTYWWLAAFLAVATVSTSVAPFPWQALLGSMNRQGLLTLVLYAVLALLGTQVVRTPQRVRRLQAAVVLGGVPIAVLALLQVAGVYTFYYFSAADGWAVARGISTFGNPDPLGGYLVLPTVMAAAYALTEGHGVRRAVSWVSFAVLSAALFATLARGAWLGGLIGMVVLIVAARRQSVRFTKGDAATLGVCGMAAVAAVWPSLPAALRRAEELFSLEAAYTSGRLPMWEVGLKAIREHWLIGIGPDSFRYAYMPLRSAEHLTFGGSTVISDDAHNYLIQLAVTVGVPALLIALAFLFSTLVQSGRIALSSASADNSRLAYAGWLAGIVGYCVYLFFGPERVGSSTVMWIGFGVLLAARAYKPDIRWRASVGAGISVCVVVVILATGTVTAMARSNYYIQQSKQSLGDVSIAAARKAQAAMPWLLENRYQVAYTVSLRAVSLVGGGANAESRAAAEETVSLYEDLMEFAPDEYLVTMNFANMLNKLAPVLGRTAAEQALVMARRANELFPAALNAEVAEAIALISLDRPEEAVTLLEDIWDSDPTYAEPGVRYARALWLVGRQDEAREIAYGLKEEFPSDDAVQAVFELVGTAPAE
ncbi:MAG: O-antigen ligase family protein [Coriobacteriia bacterium]|nr:O-antigen ligase family protein [Coriobacteriia bacterium]